MRRLRHVWSSFLGTWQGMCLGRVDAQYKVDQLAVCVLLLMDTSLTLATCVFKWVLLEQCTRITIQAKMWVQHFALLSFALLCFALLSSLFLSIISTASAKTDRSRLWPNFRLPREPLTVPSVLSVLADKQQQTTVCKGPIEIAHLTATLHSRQASIEAAWLNGYYIYNRARSISVDVQLRPVDQHVAGERVQRRSIVGSREMLCKKSDLSCLFIASIDQWSVILCVSVSRLFLCLLYISFYFYDWWTWNLHWKTHSRRRRAQCNGRLNEWGVCCCCCGCCDCCFIKNAGQCALMTGNWAKERKSWER